MSYAFTFDAKSCSGCKACQEACKDKNQLPVGILWRRVIEISGGEWHAVGAAWESSVFAYYFSLACNHCTHPKCAGVCPTSAFDVQEDGIVLIQASKCMGCGYCAWACPYGVPQLDTRLGVMTKCDFCLDNLQAGLPPSCVAACPLRVLDYEHIENLESHNHMQKLWQLPANQHPFPLPNSSRTEPHLAISLHRDMENPLEKQVANLEEVLPPDSLDERQRGLGELPLVGFTLLYQMAVGMAVCSLGLPSIPMNILIMIGFLLAAGGLFSFLHLGRKRNAWRAITHLKKSWLSREVLLAAFFGLAWMVAVGSQWAGKNPVYSWPMAVLGIGLIYCMSRVYLLRSIPAWNSWRTLASFLLSAAVLGSLGINLIIHRPGWLVAAALAMAVEIILAVSEKHSHVQNALIIKIILLGIATLGALLTSLLWQSSAAWLAISILILAMAAEIIGRWQFYTARNPFLMHSN